MRLILSIFGIAALPGVAIAHTLAADQGLARQIIHQIFGWHHLPLLLSLIAAGVIVSLRAAPSARKRKQP